MKQLRIIMAALVAMVLVSCAKEPGVDMAADGGTYRFDINIESPVGAAVRAVTDDELVKTKFETGDRIGLYVMMRPSSQTEAQLPGSFSSRIRNAAMSYNAVTDTWTFVVASNEELMVRRSGYTYDFYAYYPYSANVGSDPLNISYDMSEGDNFDFMSARNTEVGNDTIVSLTFEHHTSLVEVRNPGMGSRGSIALDLTGFTPSMTLNLGTGETTLGEPLVEWMLTGSAIIPIPSYTIGKARLYMPAQTIDKEASQELGLFWAMPYDEVEDLDSIQSFALSADLVLQEGYSNVVNIIPTLDGAIDTPNCIIINNASPAETMLSVRKAYAMWLADNNLNQGDVNFYGNDVEIVQLWADDGFDDAYTVSLTDEGLGINSMIKIERIADTYGLNAVYGLKLGDQILWSWHIWATEGEPSVNADYNTGQAAYAFMDRYLGASSTTTSGLYYQFGRKDPFPYSAVAAESGISNVAATVLNPTTFGADWNPNYETGLWANTGSKSPYDPCPEGWRVPARVNGYSPWHLNGSLILSDYSTGVWSATDGILFDATNYQLGQYSKTNYLKAVTGVPTEDNEGGAYAWSAQGNGLGVYFDQSVNGYVVNTEYLPAKGAGLAVRCVSE